MRRKPSASHCVKKPPPEVYRPDSRVFFSGAQVLRISSVKLPSGRLSMTSRPSSWRNDTDSPLTRQRVSVMSSPCSLQRAGGDGAVALDLHPVDDHRLGRVEVERQVDLPDPERRRGVVLAADQGSGAFTHGSLRMSFLVVVVGAVDYTPCFRLASMKGSRSPSSTFCVLLISTLVRRSLIRLWSST